MANPLVGIIMGSLSDWDTMSACVQVLEEFGVANEKEVVSAHRTPESMAEYAKSAEGRGLKIIVAGAGGAAHLPGMVASHTLLPVIGVPVHTKALGGLDSLYSIVQMPSGIPVATVGIGNATNAGLLAVRFLATQNAELRVKLGEYEASLRAKVEQMNADLKGLP